MSYEGYTIWVYKDAVNPGVGLLTVIRVSYDLKEAGDRVYVWETNSAASRGGASFDNLYKTMTGLGFKSPVVVRTIVVDPKSGPPAVDVVEEC